MVLGIVVGTVTSSSNNTGIPGGRYLLVNICTQEGKLKNDFLVAFDLVSAGYGEMVMVSQSTSARETPTTRNKAIDALIVGIVDTIDENEKVVFKK